MSFSEVGRARSDLVLPNGAIALWADASRLANISSPDFSAIASYLDRISYGHSFLTFFPDLFPRTESARLFLRFDGAPTAVGAFLSQRLYDFSLAVTFPWSRQV